MRVIRDIWVCGECLQAAVNGDLSSLDYHYNEKEAKRREQEICAGLEALPGLCADDGDDQLECRDCGYIHSRDHFIPFETEYEGEISKEYQCPECHSIETRQRESGHDEFSRSDCDCCGTDLAGDRYRMAQLLPDEA